MTRTVIGIVRGAHARCKTPRVLDFEGGDFVGLDLGFTPSPSGGGISLVQAEEVHDAFLILGGYTPGLDAPDRQEATALVTVVGLAQSVFGYPNEEAFWSDHRGDGAGHGFYEVRGSKWLDNLTEYNDRTYGSRNPDWKLRGGFFQGARHFFVGSKDASAQFLAQGLQVESFTDRPYRAIWDEAARRVENWFDWRHLYGGAADAQAAVVRSYPKITESG